MQPTSGCESAEKMMITRILFSYMNGETYVCHFCETMVLLLFHRLPRAFADPWRNNISLLDLSISLCFSICSISYARHQTLAGNTVQRIKQGLLCNVTHSFPSHNTWAEPGQDSCSDILFWNVWTFELKTSLFNFNSAICQNNLNTNFIFQQLLVAKRCNGSVLS